MLYANVTPVFKKYCPSNLKNYRPISLISILAKIMERLVYKHIYNYLIDNNLITSHQSGFTPGDSAVNQLLYITNEFGRALDEGKEIKVITKLPNSEQSYKGKVKTHNYINRQNQSTTGKL